MTKFDLTMGNRLEVSPFVTETKVKEVSKLVSGINTAGFASERAALQLREHLAKSDAIHSLGHLMSMKMLPDYDKAELNGSKIAAIEEVDDFEPTTFERFVPNFDTLKHGKGTKGNATAPRVPEMDTYQYAYGYKAEDVQAAIEKYGFLWGLSLETLLSPRLRARVRRAPSDMLDVATETEEFMVFDALQTGAAATTKLKAGVYKPTGAQVKADAPFSAEAARVGLSQVAQRKDALQGDRNVPVANAYWIVVGVGQAEMVEADLDRARSVAQVVDGNVILGKPREGYLSRIKGVIESQYITSDTAWYLVPDAGSTRRTSLVKLKLTGRTAPELLVDNYTGTPISGGKSGVFDAVHFSNDTATLKLRMFTNAALVTQDQMVWSAGTGV